MKRIAATSRAVYRELAPSLGARRALVLTALINCPKKHVMVWLGSAFWICSKCHQIYVQTKGQS